MTPPRAPYQESGRAKRFALESGGMGVCFLCRGQSDTRKVYMGSARGFADLCIDCVIKFYKIKSEQ